MFLLPPDYVRFLISLIACIPLSYLERYVGNYGNFSWAKHVYNIVCCILITEFNYFRGSILISLLPLVLLWYSQKYIVEHNIQKRKRLWILLGTWGITFIYLSVFQINRMMQYWLLATIDVTTTQLMMTVRMTQFATNVYNGDFDSKKDDAARMEYPSLMEFLGYCYFLPAFLVGPIITFKEFRSWMERSDIHEPNCGQTANDNHDNGKDQIIFLTFKTIVFFALAAIGMVFFDIFYAVTSESFQVLPLIFKLMYLYVSIALIRFKYYFIWSLSEIAFHVNGLWKHTEHKGRNVDIPGIELGGSPHEILNSWNISVNRWLKNCVYKVLLSLNVARTYAILATNLVSALWHGFYPGYYLAFIGGGLATMVHQKWRKYITNRYIDETNEYYVKASRAYMGLLLIFIGGPFVLCDLWYSLTYYATLKFYGFVLLAGSFALVNVISISSQ